MRIVTSRIMAEIDTRSQEFFHIPGILLMENAGLKAFLRMREIWGGMKAKPDFRDIKIVCIAGGGNNGGDALVIARQARIAGVSSVHVILRSRRMNELVRIHTSIVESLAVPVLVWEEDEQQAGEIMRTADLIVDGIAGTGMKGALHGSAAGLVEWMRTETSAYVASVDIPSGLGPAYESGSPAVRADLTLTMGLPKYSLYTPAGRAFCGTIEVIDPGFPPELLEDPRESGVLIIPVDDSTCIGDYSIEHADRTAYKNRRGHLGIFAGQEGTTGAAVLAAESAGRTGTGLVTLYSDPDIYKILAAQSRSIMVKPLPKTGKGGRLQKENLQNYSALLAGPGWGIRDREAILTELLESGLPGVLDADGIKVLVSIWMSRGSEYVRSVTGGRWILTPHPGECMGLLENSGKACTKEQLLADPLKYMLEISSELQVILMLKTHVTWIVSPDGRYTVVDGMNPAMGTGGSGDVLAGVTAGLLSRGADPFEAAVGAVTLHQLAGRRAASEIGWFLAEDLPVYVSEILGEENAPKI